MARSVINYSLSAKIEGLLRNSIDGNNRFVTVNQGFTRAPTLATGTSADQADIIFCKNDVAILSGANLDLDMYDLGATDWFGYGANKDAVGLSVAIVEVVAVLIVVDTASAGILKVGGEGSAAAWNSPFDGSDTAKIGPFGAGGHCYLFNPVDPAWVVADGSNHLLRLAAVSGNLVLDLAILGRSA